METTSSKAQERENPSSTTSPHSNGGGAAVIPTPALTPKSITRSNETNPYPTTFVQADTSTFKQVVQMLTGSSRTDPPPQSSAARGGTTNIPPIKSSCQKKQGFKLYERRNSLKNGLMINTLIPAGFSQNSRFSPRNKPEILSPSILDFPSLVLSPVTPLNEDNLSKFSAAPSPLAEEEKAIAEKKFYFHPSPRTTPSAAVPELLPLFPVTSPRVSGSSS
ncbi:hypothetical protein BUALT_Bualt18G0049900 [Buddleja alternifolia]|uniref:VQ domain-containing protein n=1 Tax=Buddleja alternifolia TaxID=168488 RepID=A0AAV6WD93_9LAMI|nr:hypothetical protein BUALT_Bualt18G0049900 [Buddleja alternifolia]